MTVAPHPLPTPPAGSLWNEQRMKDIEEYLSSAAQRPKPVWTEALAWEMCCAHALMYDLIKRAYLYAPYAVEKDDLLNYLGYAEVGIYQLVNHHHFEETEIFPYIESKTGADVGLQHNVESHHTFTPPMHATWLYIRRCRALLPNAAAHPSPVPEPDEEIRAIDLKGEYGLDPAEGFNPAKLQKLMDTWVRELMYHLRDEIDTLDVDLATRFGEKNQEDLRKLVTKHLQAYDPAWFLCSTFATMPIGVCKELIGLPLPVRRLLLPLWWSKKHWGMWLYCAHPENLTFAGTA